YILYSQKTKPHEIFAVSKYVFNIIKDMNSIGWNTLQNLKSLELKLNGNTIKEILQIAKEESKISDIIDNSDLILDLYEKYGYKDLKRLILYSCREVKLQQGIMRANDCLQILRDYSRMCAEIKISYDKYPKSLKKDHDIATMNYHVNKDKVRAEKFLEVIKKEEYKALEYKPKK